MPSDTCIWLSSDDEDGSGRRRKGRSSSRGSGFFGSSDGPPPGLIRRRAAARRRKDALSASGRHGESRVFPESVHTDSSRGAEKAKAQDPPHRPRECPPSPSDHWLERKADRPSPPPASSFGSPLKSPTPPDPQNPARPFPGGTDSASFADLASSFVASVREASSSTSAVIAGPISAVTPANPRQTRFHSSERVPLKPRPSWSSSPAGSGRRRRFRSERSRRDRSSVAAEDAFWAESESVEAALTPSGETALLSLTLDTAVSYGTETSNSLCYSPSPSVTGAVSKLFPSEQDLSEELTAPLLEAEAPSGEEEEAGAAGGGSVSSVAEAAATAAAQLMGGGEGGAGEDGFEPLSGDPNAGEGGEAMTGTHTPHSARGRLAVLRTALARSPIFGMRSAADALIACSERDGAPVVLMPIAAALTQPKFAVAGVVAGWLALLVLWLPFKLLSMVVTEIGVYALVVGGGYKLGRSLVRLIAFPGSTHRVYGEIEAEFARYSVRMLDASCSNVIEAAEAAIYLGDEDTGDESSQRPVRNAGMFRMGMGDLGPLWRRAGSYRDRVLGMYSDVMSNLVEASEGRPPADDLGAGSGGLNKYGNNPLKGDVGDLSTVTPQSREDAKALSELLHRVLVNMDQAERAMGPVLNDKSGGTSRSSTPPEAVAKCRALLRTAMELKEFLPSLRPPSQNDTSNGGGGNSSGGNGDEGNERNGLQSPNQSADDAMANTAGDPSGPSGAVDAVRSGAASVLTVVDPPPHPSPFGLDVLRGCMLSRYKGARQLWVRRPGTKFSGGGGGRVDVIHIPAEGGAATASRGSIPRAVLYCNPNAGLSEVATGMSLIGGNVTPESAQPKGSSGSASFADENCWTDFYLRTGYDVFLFNYAGFGRSHGGRARTKSYKSGCVPRVGRMAKGALWDFAPSAQTLKTDAHAVARHLVTELGVERLVVHGESIGGMAAAGAARRLGEKGAVDMSLNRRASHPALLLCDRSFSNLEGVAQRLVGSWTGDAIRALTPLWNTDVASDFLSASCPKAVASDASDAIIADASSLKSGLALSLELRGGKTKGAGRMVSPPLEYRMSDWEGTGAGRSKFAPGKVVQVPTWPNDRRITENEAFHFAACARRIGKAASSARRRTGYNAYTPATGPSEEEDEGIEITELELTEEDGNINDTGVGGKGGNGGSLPPNPEALLVDAWRSLACTDGLCGLPLGAAIKDGHDAVVSWLCCAVIFGGQVVVSAAQKRALGPGGGGARGTEQTTILPEDFDFRPGGYELTEEDGTGVHPVPLPEVVALLRRALDAASGGGVLSDLAPELRYCAGMLDYVVTRISSAGVVRDSTRALRLKPPLSDGGGGRLGCGSSGSPGRFLDLRCGHNNQYSGEEKEMLRGVLRLVDDDGGNNVV